MRPLKNNAAPHRAQVDQQPTAAAIAPFESLLQAVAERAAERVLARLDERDPIAAPTEVLDTDGVCELLHLSRQTMLQLGVPCVLLGANSIRRYIRADVLAWLRERSGKAAAP